MLVTGNPQRFTEYAALSDGGKEIVIAHETLLKFLTVFPDLKIRYE